MNIHVNIDLNMNYEFDKEPRYRPSSSLQQWEIYSVNGTGTAKVSIDEEYLNHLRFAYDIFLIANKPGELQQLINS